jgi:hypothetical protein
METWMAGDASSCATVLPPGGGGTAPCRRAGRRRDPGAGRHLYTNDFPILCKKVSIVGVGGMARLVATTIDVTLHHGEFAGARVADRNGACIHYEGGKLTVRKCWRVPVEVRQACSTAAV